MTAQEEQGVGGWGGQKEGAERRAREEGERQIYWEGATPLPFPPAYDAHLVSFLTHTKLTALSQKEEPDWISVHNAH